MFELNGICYAGEQTEMIKITNAKITGNHMMLITFSTGEKRVFDALELTGSAYEPLQDEDVFQNYKIVHGVITWMNEEIDCAPEYMYEHSYAYDEMLI